MSECQSRKDSSSKPIPSRTGERHREGKTLAQGHTVSYRQSPSLQIPTSTPTASSLQQGLEMKDRSIQRLPHLFHTMCFSAFSNPTPYPNTHTHLPFEPPHEGSSSVSRFSGQTTLCKDPEGPHPWPGAPAPPHPESQRLAGSSTISRTERLLSPG